MSNADNTPSNAPPATNVASSLAANAGPVRLSNAGRKRRSCVTCSKRKVKCDKQQPCHSCTKIGSECVFPHISNRSQLTLTPELMEMLQRLERVVQTLEPREQERSVETLHQQSNPQYDDHQQPVSSFTLDTAPTMPVAEHSQENMDVGPFDQSFGVEPSEPNIDVESDTQGPWPSIKIPSASSSYKESPGRIVRDHGRDTYVKRWFWDECSTETSSGFTMDDDDCLEIPEVQEHMPKSTTTLCPGSTGVLGSEYPTLDPREKTLYVLFEQRIRLWNIYKERVEPLTKLFHLPSLEQAVIGSHQQNSDNGMECVLFAIFYGAVTSLGEEECVTIFQDGQAQVLRRIREELELRLSGSMLVHTSDIRPLQALTLYLAFLRHHDPRISWTLSGVAIRLAQNFGLHREDSLFGLSKFEIEMRRRLWWQIAILDAPSAEDYSGEYNLLEMGTFDTRLPQNLNDVQLDPEMTEYPPETRGFTDMTFTLVRCEVTNMYRCIADSRKICGKIGKSYADLTPRERADWVDDCEAQFSERFLQDSSPSNALHWVTAILSRMLFHKLRLHGCNPLRDATVISDDDRQRLFLVAVEVIELHYKLRTDPRTRPWLWLFSSHTQWHAFSLVLVWLQMDPLCKSSHRAWKAVEKAIVLRWEHPSSLLSGRKPQQWRSVIRMLEKARSARREALSKRSRRDSRQGFSGGSLGSSSTATATNNSFNITNHADQPMQSQQNPQFHAQQHPTPPLPFSDNLSSGIERDMVMTSPGNLQDLDGPGDFYIGDIPDLPPYPDFMSMDTELPGPDLQDGEVFSCLDNMR